MSYPDSIDGREVIVGGGVHAAIYVATRKAMGKPLPVVFERQPRLGGIFAQLTDFPLNSINYASLASVATGVSRIPSDDPSDDLNYLPNATSQVRSESSTEYPSSRAMAYAIEDSLVSTGADIYTNAPVTFNYDGEFLTSAGTSLGIPSRIIWAAGLAMTRDPVYDGCTGYVTAQEFMETPNQYPRSPRLAVVGSGDSAATCVEILIQRYSEYLRRIDWYGQIPLTKKRWALDYHARYIALARHFPQAGTIGLIRPQYERPSVYPAGNYAGVGNQLYPLVIDARGFKPVPNPLNPTRMRFGSAGYPVAVTNSFSDSTPVNGQPPVYTIGAASGLAGITRGSRFRAARQAIFALAPLTADFAASLP